MKLSKWQAILLALRLATRIVAALNDPETPGQITREELAQIITQTVAEFLGSITE